MGNSNSNNRSKSAASSNRTSPTQAVINSRMQVSHLDGLSQKHALDVAANFKSRNKGHVAAALAEAATMESFFHGSGPRAELVTNIWFGDAGVGFETADGHNGDPVVMPGADWQELIMRADANRFSHRDSRGKPRGQALARAFESTGPQSETGLPPFDSLDGEIEPVAENEKGHKKPPETSRQLSKIYARLPAWVASAALAENIDRTTLVDVVTKVAKAFQVETGRRVIGANIHVETCHDIHVHLVHTVVIPRKIIKEKEYTKYSLQNIDALQRKVAKARLVGRGIVKPSTREKDAERELMYSSGELVNPRKGEEIVEYWRLERPESARKNFFKPGAGLLFEDDAMGSFRAGSCGRRSKFSKIYV